jgi:hypothetical protein
MEVVLVLFFCQFKNSNKVCSVSKCESVCITVHIGWINARVI